MSAKTAQKPPLKTNSSAKTKASPALTPREAAAMSFAGMAFKEPWFNLAGVLSRLEKGEDLDSLDRRVDPVLLPFALDAGLARWAMKLGGLNLMIGGNASMLTLVLNETGDRLIWACLEGETGGVYTELVPLAHRLDEPWAQDLARLLRDKQLEEAYDYAREFLSRDPSTAHIALGVIKVANIKFFEAFQHAWENSGDGKNVPLLLLGMQRAVEKIVRHGWVTLFPAAGLEYGLRVLKPALMIASPANRALIGFLKLLPGPQRAA